MSAKNISHICDYCGEEHFITSTQNNRLISGKQKKSYCSNECKSLSQHNGENIKCDNCGKEFYRRNYHIENTNNNFCSLECCNDYKSKEAREFRQCVECGKEFETYKRSSQRFCSNECNSKWQSTLTGLDNHKFKQQIVKCEYCNEPHYTMQYRIDRGQHIFCSVECRQKWYAEFWCQQEDWKIKSRKKILETLSSGKMSSTQSKPQKIIDILLNNMNINYIREKTYGYFSVDNYLTDYNLIIEIQGDYWHSNPTKYINKINQRQSKGIRNDKAKHTYIKKYYEIEILYLWEYDIYHNIELCEKLIDIYIKKNGKLKNYHSFNYYINQSDINLHSYITIPYQDMKYELYKNKIEKVS